MKVYVENIKPDKFGNYPKGYYQVNRSEEHFDKLYFIESRLEGENLKREKPFNVYWMDSFQLHNGQQVWMPVKAPNLFEVLNKYMKYLLPNIDRKVDRYYQSFGNIIIKETYGPSVRSDNDLKDRQKSGSRIIERELNISILLWLARESDYFQSQYVFQDISWESKNQIIEYILSKYK